MTHWLLLLVFSIIMLHWLLMALKVTQIAVGGFDENFSYLVHDEESKQGFVIDPSGSFHLVEHAVEVLKLNMIGILLTHTHHDHFDALDVASASYRVQVFVHERGLGRISTPDAQPLKEGMSLPLGNYKIEVLHTPGHIEDAVCFYVAATDDKSPSLITGDTLFVDGCGRTNEDSVRQLFDSLQRIKQLPADTVIFPGHDYGSIPTAVLRDQLISNKYLNTDSFDEFKARRLPPPAV